MIPVVIVARGARILIVSTVETGEIRFSNSGQSSNGSNPSERVDELHWKIGQRLLNKISILTTEVAVLRELTVVRIYNLVTVQNKTC